MKKSELRQDRILAFMKKTIAEKGFPPTVREICSALEIKSTSTVHNDIKVLEDKGLVKKDPAKPRTVLPVDMGKDNSDSLSNQGDNFAVFENANIDIVSVPLIGRVSAGQPILSEQNIEDNIPVPSRFIGPGNNFILTVHGDSMINVGINDGDYILINESKEAYNGEIVVAMVQGEYDCEATVKRFYKEDGHIRLQPENDSMSPIIVDDCTLIGKVRGVFRYIN